jgi:hypothetical protein
MNERNALPLLIALMIGLIQTPLFAQASTRDPLVPPPRSGFSLESKDRDFGMTVGARVQARYVLQDLQHHPAHTFQIRRARVQLKGHAFGDDNRLYIQLGFSPADMTGGLLSDDGSPRRVPLRDARIEFHQTPWAQVWIGQMKVPYSRERIVSDAHLDLMERSVLNDEFNLDRDVGLQVRADDLAGRVGYAVGVFSGQGRNVYTASALAGLFVSRLQLRWFGRLDEKTQGDLQRTARPAAGMGLAYVYQPRAPGDRGVHGSRPTDGGTTDIESATTDFVFKWRGWALEAAVMARRGVRRAAEDQPILEAARNGWGWLTQLGWLVPRTRLEMVSRYATVAPFSTQAQPSSLTSVHEIHAGLNYYLGGHDLKIQVDVGHRWHAAQARNSVPPTQTVRLQVQLAL